MSDVPVSDVPDTSLGLPPEDTVDAWPADQVAAADAAALATGADLMAVASAALAHACARLLRRRVGRVSGTRAVLLVGAGNNGGDTLLAGALLRARGVAVTALLCGPRHHEPGARALVRAGGRLVAVPELDPTGDATDGPPDDVLAALASADLVVDGLLGIGARGAPRGAGAGVLAALARGPRPPAVVACDLPSGMDPDSGALAGDVLAADLTVTFGAAKPGLLLPGASPVVGPLVVVDLGLRPHLPATPALRRLRSDVGPEEAAPLVDRWWPWAWREADKYARGVLGVVAGEAQYPGAAVLACAAAVTAGAGLVRLVPPDDAPDVARLVLAAVPEVVVQPLPGTGRVQAWVVGPGTSGEDDPRVRHVLRATDEPAVVDAGALRELARAHTAGTLRRPDRLLLTPHAGELATLCADLGLSVPDLSGPLAERLVAARSVAAATGACVLLKGPDTLVVAPDGPPVVVPGGPPSLATAGAGDVLAGLAGTLLAGGCPPARAAVLAAHVHAVAAHRAAAGGPLRASAVVAAVQGVLASAHARAWDHG